MSNAYVSLDEAKRRLTDLRDSDDTLFLGYIERSSRAIDDLLDRWFYEVRHARFFGAMPGDRESLYYIVNDRYVVDPWRRQQGVMSLDTPDLIDVVELATDDNSDGTFSTIWTAADYLLTPRDKLPPTSGLDNAQPYTGIEVSPVGNRDAFPSGSSVIRVDGFWGYARKLLRIGGVVDTAGIAVNAVTLPVTDAVGIESGHTLLVGEEQLYVTSVSSNDVSVRRAMNGTEASQHDSGDAIDIYQYPGPIVDATFIQAARLWRRKDAALIEEIGMSESGQQGVARNVDDEVFALIVRYKRRKSIIIL